MLCTCSDGGMISKRAFVFSLTALTDWALFELWKRINFMIYSHDWHAKSSDFASAWCRDVMLADCATPSRKTAKKIDFDIIVIWNETPLQPKYVRFSSKAFVLSSLKGPNLFTVVYFGLVTRELWFWKIAIAQRNGVCDGHVRACFEKNWKFYWFVSVREVFVDGKVPRRPPYRQEKYKIDDCSG